MHNSPWGDLRVKDAHVHFFSHAFYSALAAQKKAEDAAALGPFLNWEIPSPAPEALADRWISELDRNGIDTACLIGSKPGDEESVARAVAAFPQRFYGYSCWIRSSPTLRIG